MCRTVGKGVSRLEMYDMEGEILTRLRSFNRSSFSLQTSSFPIGLGNHICL